jgi:hypothetical protein
MMLLDEMSDDCIAVADMLALIEDIGQLAARGGFRVENVLMMESQVAKLEERENLKPIRIIVRDAEQLGVGKER